MIKLLALLFALTAYAAVVRERDELRAEVSKLEFYIELLEVERLEGEK